MFLITKNNLKIKVIRRHIPNQTFKVKQIFKCFNNLQIVLKLTILVKDKLLWLSIFFYSYLDHLYLYILYIHLHHLDSYLFLN